MKRAAKLLLALAAGGAIVSGHPMGNFSVSHYTRLTAAPGTLRIVYALDLAEIPSFELARDQKVPPQASPSEIGEFAKTAMGGWVSRLDLRVDGQPVNVKAQRIEAAVTNGAGGTPVIRMTAFASVPLPRAGARIAYRDPNFEGRAGWNEIVVDNAPGVTLERPLPDISGALTAYPPDPLAAPPQELAVNFDWTPPAPVAAWPTAAAPMTAPKRPCQPPWPPYRPRRRHPSRSPHRPLLNRLRRRPRLYPGQAKAVCGAATSFRPCSTERNCPGTPPCSAWEPRFCSAPCTPCRRAMARRWWRLTWLAPAGRLGTRAFSARQ